MSRHPGDCGGVKEVVLYSTVPAVPAGILEARVSSNFAVPLSRERAKVSPGSS